MLDKTYLPAAVEGRTYADWENSGAFRAGAGATADAESYCIVIPPPNVTGSLHMGHALNNTLQDILIRFERMRGRDVLWQPGTDHAGIATQMGGANANCSSAEERRLVRDLGRDALRGAGVGSWKAESGGHHRQPAQAAWACPATGPASASPSTTDLSAGRGLEALRAHSTKKG